MLQGYRQEMSRSSSTDSKADSVSGFAVMVLTAAFGVGTATHTVDLFRYGIFGYTGAFGVSTGVNIFWTLLLPVDLLVIILLIRCRIVGPIAAAVVLAADAAVNYQVLRNSDGAFFDGPQFALQCAALLFAAGACPLLFEPFVENRIVRRLVHGGISAVPFLGLLAGLLIHLKGLSAVVSGSVARTPWTLWVHGSMLFFDTILLLGLALRLKAAFLIAVAAASGFGLLQLGFAAANYAGTGPPFTVAMGITVGLCTLSVASLLRNRKAMGRKLGVFGV